MNRQQRFCTAVQEIALNLIFTVLGERRVNRSREEYDAIVASLPPLKVLTFEVNETLRWMHKRSACSGVPLPQICRRHLITLAGPVVGRPHSSEVKNEGFSRAR